jgi:hypothetical protein
MTDFVRKVVKLPYDIIQFFASVHFAILNEDEVATVVSDDLLQEESIYGGLIDPRKKLYAFTWLPDSAPNERWEFQLLADEIDEIGSGYRKELQIKAYPKK